MDKKKIKWKSIIIVLVIVIVTNLTTLCVANYVSFNLPNGKVLVSRNTYENILDFEKLYTIKDKLKKYYLEDIDSFEDLIIELAEWVYCANNLVPKNVGDQTEVSAKVEAPATSEALTSYQRGLLLQQYGAPSAYLDITSDSEIAAWFATHRCTNNAEGKMQYENYFWDDSDPENWPTIFIFPLVKGAHPYMDLASILSTSHALRPARQKCGLLGGAGNLARNYCARYLGLKIRLKPGFTLSNPVSASELFPSATEDNALSFLKEQGLGSSGRHFAVSELA